MSKKIGVVIIAACLVGVLVYVGSTPTDEQTAESIIMTLKELEDAQAMYVSVEESQQIDEELVNKVKMEGYWDTETSAMWFNEELSEDETNNSFIVKHGTESPQIHGSFDFISNYTDDFALTFSATQLISYISLLQSSQFDIQPSKGGFLLKCNDEKLILSSNDYIYEDIDEENGSIADILGWNIQATLEISIKKNKFNGVDIVGTTNISGDQHYITLTKFTQFKTSTASLTEAQKKITENKSKYFTGETEEAA